MPSAFLLITNHSFSVQTASPIKKLLFENTFGLKFDFDAFYVKLGGNYSSFNHKGIIASTRENWRNINVNSKSKHIGFEMAFGASVDALGEGLIQVFSPSNILNVVFD